MCARVRNLVARPLRFFAGLRIATIWPRQWPTVRWARPTFPSEWPLTTYGVKIGLCDGCRGFPPPSRGPLSIRCDLEVNACFLGYGAQFIDIQSSGYDDRTISVIPRKGTFRSRNTWWITLPSGSSTLTGSRHPPRRPWSLTCQIRWVSRDGRSVLHTSMVTRNKGVTSKIITTKQVTTRRYWTALTALWATFILILCIIIKLVTRT